MKQKKHVAKPRTARDILRALKVDKKTITEVQQIIDELYPNRSKEKQT